MALVPGQRILTKTEGRPMHVREALRRYLLQLQADGRSAHTIGQYSRHVAFLAAWLTGEGHSGAIGEIDHEHLARFLVSPVAVQRPDGKAKRATSMNALRSSLRTFFGYLHAAGHIPSNPARLVRRARCGASPPRALSDDESTRLLASFECVGAPVEKRDRALFRLMLEAGVRLGSAVALNVEDLDLEQREIHLRKTKGDRPEVAYISEALAVHLKGFVGERQSGPLFLSRNGCRVSTRQVQRRLGEWLRYAGIRRHASPHSLRHTFATMLYRKTGDVFLVKEALRHRSIASTLVYTRVDRSELRRALA